MDNLEFLENLPDPEDEYQETLELARAYRKQDLMMARESLLHFMMLFRPKHDWNFHHFLICERLSTLIDVPRQRLIITVPPQYGKSEIVSRFLPAWILGRISDGKIIQASYAASLAEGFNRDCQKIMETALYRKIFPKTLIAPFAPRLKRTQEVTETSAGGYLYSVGVGGSTTGRTANPLFIVDDPIKDLEQALSDSYREFLQEWFSAVALTRLSKDASVIVMHTRWHEEDLAGWLLEKARLDPKATQWEVMNFSATADFDEKETIHPDDPRANGEALWPEVKGDEDDLEKLQRDVGDVIWNSVYQQKPQSKGGNVVKTEWWREYDELDLDDMDEICISLDAAFKDTKKADNVSISAWARKGVKKYILEDFTDKMNIIRTIEQLIAMSLIFPRAHTKLIEDKANGPAIMQLLEKDMSGMLPIEPYGSKLARVIAVSPQIQAGNVLLPSAKALIYSNNRRDSYKPTFDREIYKKEWSQFPRGKKDDRVDSGSQALNHLSRTENHYLRKLLRKDD